MHIKLSENINRPTILPDNRSTKTPSRRLPLSACQCTTLFLFYREKNGIYAVNRHITPLFVVF